MKDQNRSRSRLQFIGMLFALLLPGLAAQATGQEITGQVVEISDGDTFTLLTVDNWLIQVQLADIDAPEDRQPYSTQAKQALTELALGKSATLRIYKRDPFGRSVALVFVDTRNINHEMVHRGAARITQQDSLESPLAHAEAGARKARRGLWAQTGVLTGNAAPSGRNTAVPACDRQPETLECGSNRRVRLDSSSWPASRPTN